MTYNVTDNFTDNPDAAAAFERAHATEPHDDRPTLGDVVDETGWYPGRLGRLGLERQPRDVVVKWTDTPPDVDSGTWHDIADALLICCLLWLGVFLVVVLR